MAQSSGMDEGTVHQPSAVTENQETVKTHFYLEKAEELVQSFIYGDGTGDIEKNLDQTPEKTDSKKNELAIKSLLNNLPNLSKNFDLHKKIGEGTFSNVYLATLKQNHNSARQFAIKHLVPTCHPKRIKSELQCLHDIGGKDNVVSCIASMRMRDCIVFIMPYLPHNKFSDYVLDMDVNETRLYMRNLLLALRRVHSFNIIHRDIKPSNFLYNRHTKEFLLVDFGLAQKVCSEEESIKSSHLKRKRDDVENETKDFKKLKHLSQKGESIFVKSKPFTDVSNRRPLLNRNKQPLSSMQRLAEAARVKRNLEDSLNYENLHYHKTETEGNTTKCNIMRQPLSSNPVNVKNNSPQKIVTEDNTRKQTFQCLLPQNSQASNTGGSSYIRVQNSQVQLGCMFPRPVGPVRRPSVAACKCAGKPQVCNICLTRNAQNAPRAGTAGFRPPEVLLKYPRQTTAVDIWSSGIIMLCIISGSYPFFRSADDVAALSEMTVVFGTQSIKTIANKLGRNIIYNRSQARLDIEQLCMRLRRCKKQNYVYPNSLPDCKDCGHKIHPTEQCLCADKAVHVHSDNPGPDCYPQSAFDLLKRLLDVDPSTRITAEQALNHPFLQTQA